MTCTTRLGYFSCAPAPWRSKAARMMAAASRARLRITLFSMHRSRSGVTADGLLQNAHHVGVAAGAGVVDRGLALAVLDTAVGAGRDQRVDGLDVRLAALAEHNCGYQGGPAAPVDELDYRSLHDHLAHVLD